MTLELEIGDGVQHGRVIRACPPDIAIRFEPAEYDALAHRWRTVIDCDFLDADHDGGFRRAG